MAAILLAASAGPATAQDGFCAAFAGAAVIGAGGAFIGRIAPATAADSIFNRRGDFGNRYAPASIWNPHGANGSPHGAGSVFNRYSASPPRLMVGDRVVGVLNVDRARAGAVSPVAIGALCYHYIAD